MLWFAGHYLDDSGVAARRSTFSPAYALDEVLAAHRRRS